MSPQDITFASLGEIFDGPHATPMRKTEGPYFLNIASLVDGRLDLTQSDHVSREDFSRWTRRVTPREGDLLFSYETRLGDAALMPAGVEACLGRRMALLRPNRERVDPRFLLYFYLSPVFREVIDRHTIHGATVNRIGLSTMGSWPVTIPSLAEQRAIAEVLGALDDKIAANTNLAFTADAWVRAVFADVASGAQGKVALGQLITLVRELVEPSLLPVDTVYVGLEHIPRRFMWIDSCGTAVSITSTKSRFKAGDVLFGKLRPYFHKVVSAPVGGVCSTDVLVVRAVDEEMVGFVLAAITSDEVVQRCTAASEGTRMPRASWKDLASVEVAWPGDTAALALSEKISGLRNAVEDRLSENEILAATRDALLPQLMSGKIRVKDAEKTVEEVL